MILPKNGRVIIIDDDKDQAFPLISTLSKYNIAASYFDGTSVETMPSKKFNDARVVFLDINLNGVSQPNWKTEKGLIINAISGILEKKTPYILFIWSVKSEEIQDGEETLFQKVSELFDNELVDYKPIIPPLDTGKQEVFKMEIVEKEGYQNDLKWVLNHSPAETMELIKGKIDEGIGSFDSIEALLKWENIVDKSAGMVVNNILSLANTNGKIDLNLKQIYLSLAAGYWGKTLKDKQPADIITKSLASLNSILNDKIEHLISKELKIELLKDFPDKLDVDLNTRAELNTRLLFSEDLEKGSLPGNIYVIPNESHKEKIVKDMLDRSTFRSKYCIENEIELKESYDDVHKKPLIKYGYKKEKEAIADAMYFEIELTPICDYSQDNMVFCRMVSGIIMSNTYFYNVKKTAEYFYKSPVFLFKNKAVNFYCDFRFIQSREPAEVETIAPILRVRHLFQSDIQSHLARQVSRPGVVSI